MSAGWAAGYAAVATGVATNAATSFINNGGNLGAVFKDVTSSDALRGYFISGVTAGLTASVFDDLLKTTTNPSTGKITVDLSSLDGVGRFAGNQVLQGGTSALLGKALGQDVSVNDVLKVALFNTLAAASFNAVGDYTKGVIADGSAAKVVVHAMVGGLLSEITGGDFATGALAAGANEALIVDLNKLVGGNPQLLSMASQIVGVLAASTRGNDVKTLQNGAWVANNATQYNFGEHPPSGLAEYAQAATGLVEYMQSQGASNDEIAQAQRALARGEGFDGVQPATEFVKAWAAFMAGELSGWGLAALVGKAGSWFTNEAVYVGAKGIQKVPGLGEVDDFFASQSTNLNKKLGAKIGEGRLPYEASRTGVEQAKATVKETLENATSVSPVIPSSTVRGNYDLVHVYSSKTNSTVSLRVLPDGKYEFDTLIPEKSSKF